MIELNKNPPSMFLEGLSKNIKQIKTVDDLALGLFRLTSQFAH